MSTGRRQADAIIHRLARDQFGAVNRRQLHIEGVSDRQTERRADNGELIPLGNGVFAVPSAPATHLRQYKAAELSVPDAALCGLAAAKMHDLGATLSAAPEIVVHPSSNHRCAFARVQRRRDVHITSVQKIRVTTIPQTLVDLSGRLRLPKLDETWTSALIRNRTTLDALGERVEAAEAQRLAHRGAARAMLASLVRGVELADSELEALLFDVASRVPGIPPLARQIALPWWSAGQGRGDVGIPAWRTILEADGRAWHARLADFDTDRMRDNRAVANGWAVLRFGAVHLRHMPEHVIELIEDTGRHRRAA